MLSEGAGHANRDLGAGRARTPRRRPSCWRLRWARCCTRRLRGRAAGRCAAVCQSSCSLCSRWTLHGVSHGDRRISPTCTWPLSAWRVALPAKFWLPHSRPAVQGLEGPEAASALEQQGLTLPKCWGWPGGRRALEGARKAAQPAQPQPQGAGRRGAQHGRVCRGLQGAALPVWADLIGVGLGSACTFPRRTPGSVKGPC